MAQHIKLDQDKDTLILDVAKTALRTAKSAQTRKGGSAFYPTGDGQGVLVGGMADHGVDKWDPETGEQSPLWEGISQEELDAKGEEILNAAKTDTEAQITIVNTTITEAQQAIEANREGIEAEAYLRAEGDKLAQDAAAAVKAETDRLSTKYDEMDTSVTTVKNDLKHVMTSTTQLEQDMIVSTLIEYAVGDSDTTPPDVTTYWLGEPNNSVSVLSDPWGPTTPERTPGTYIWMRTRVTFGDGGQETSAPVLVTGNTGAQGPQGVPGEPGEDGLPGAKGADGKTSYLHLAYANSADGTTGFSTTDSNRDYIGQYTDFVEADSTDPSKYTWSKIKGATGAQGLKGDPGATGLPGAPGTDGKTSYAHFAYANSADGRTDFSTTNGANKKYLGQYVDFVEADSTDPTKYTWSLIVGPQGPQGPQGVAGAKGDKGDDGVTRYSYFAYGTSASGANFSKTPTSNSTYIGVCVTTAATQPTDPTKYTWSLTKGATGPAGPQGAAGAKGDVGEDGKTWYTYFAYGTSASGANFSKTPTSSSTYMGVCITLDTTQPTDASRYTWSLTKGATGATGATGAQGVSVSALTPFWQLAESKPAQPVNKSPGGGWTSTEPAYARGKKLWTCSRIDYSNGQWSWTSVQQSSAFDAAELALTTADGKNRRFVQPTTPDVPASELTQGDEWWQTSSKPPETYWMGTPNNSVSVLVDHSNEVEHIWVWNGTRWALNRLSAEDIIVSGSVAAGLVTADFFDGARIRGGEFVTSNELIRLNNAGLIMDGKSGERLVTLNATDGTATFQHVAIINGSLSVPTIEGGSIEGADYKLTTGTGENKQIVAQINSSGVIFGDHLAYAKNSKGKWVLSLKGTVQAGGTVSGAHVKGGIITTNTSYDPDDPAWEFDYVETDPAKAAVKYRGVWITSGGLFAYKNNGKKEYAFAAQVDGSVVFDGPVISNATLTAPLLQTDPAADRGIKIVGNTLTAYSNSGTPMLSLNGDTGSAVLVGGFKTAQTGRRLEITNSVYGDVSVGAIHGYDLVGESWHIVGSSDRTSTSDIDNWYTASLGIGINPQQPEINIRYENRYKATVMSLLADRIDIIGAGDGNNPYGDGVYVNNRRIDWEQSWTNIALANGATAVGTAQYGQRAGLLVFRGRIKCANTGDCDLFDLSSIYSGFETSSVNRTWIIGTMTNGLATTARAYIPANSTMLRVNNGPHDWVDIGSIVIGL